MIWRNNLEKAKFWVGIYLHLVIRCSLIKFDQLKLLTAESPSLPLIALHISPHGLSTNHKCTHPCHMCSEEDAGAEFFDEFDGF
jgi:hypothetical protein